MHMPPGFAIVTPYIFAVNTDDYVRFLNAAFGAVELGRSVMPDGRIANCQVRFDTATIMISEASAAFPPSQAAFYLYVADADEAVARAIAVGAEKIMDVEDMPYGDRQGGVHDPSGNIWWVSQRKSTDPYF
ncbi:VOC family protein [Oryzifoliimicrobium ureilyticus]|uniref:VOC family protein n=1 Tax=Oryzifoliimicrobium ureilyticus TaxID=3113724 RepID=UPI0030766422